MMKKRQTRWYLKKKRGEPVGGDHVSGFLEKKKVGLEPQIMVEISMNHRLDFTFHLGKSMGSKKNIICRCGIGIFFLGIFYLETSNLN